LHVPKKAKKEIRIMKELHMPHKAKREL